MIIDLQYSTKATDPTGVTVGTASGTRSDPITFVSDLFSLYLHAKAPSTQRIRLICKYRYFVVDLFFMYTCTLAEMQQ
jgi:hypothetical protein